MACPVDQGICAQCLVRTLLFGVIFWLASVVGGPLSGLCALAAVRVLDLPRLSVSLFGGDRRFAPGRDVPIVLYLGLLACIVICQLNYSSRGVVPYARQVAPSQLTCHCVTVY